MGSFAVTNLIQPYVACWINEVTVGNLRQTQCVNAANISDSSIQEQLQAVDNSWALVTAIWNVGGMLMCFAAGPMSDYFGPKKCMFLNAFFAIAVNTCLGASRLVGSYWWLVALRFFSGMNSGFNAMLGPVYLHEIAPEPLRSVFGTTFNIMICGGMVVSEIIGLVWVLDTNALWPYAFLANNIPAVLQIALGLFAPESPVYLARLGRLKEANALEASLKGVKFVDSDALSKASAAESAGFMDIFRIKGVRRACYEVMLIFSLCQLTGLSVMFFYSLTIFKNAGIPTEYSGIATVGLGGFFLFGAVLATFIIDKTGRIKQMMYGFLVMAIMCVAFTVMLSIGESQVLAYLSMIPMFGYMLAFNIGPGSIAWIITSESVPVNCKAWIQALGSFSLLFTSFIVGLVFPALQNAIDQYVFLIFATFGGLSVLYLHFFGVETRGRSVDQVQAEFEFR